MVSCWVHVVGNLREELSYMHTQRGVADVEVEEAHRWKRRMDGL